MYIRRPLLARGTTAVKGSLFSCPTVLEQWDHCPTVLELWDPCLLGCSPPPGSSPPRPRTSQSTDSGANSLDLGRAIGSQEASQSAPRGCKRAPRAFQEAPRGSKKRSKRAPRGPLGPKRLQEAAKRPPRVDFDSPKALKEMNFELFVES